jgi:glutaredoxin
MTVLTLYGKPGCHICDEARRAVAEVREAHSFELVEIDISIDPDLSRRYGERIPVVEVDGREVFELGVDATALASFLDGHSRTGR